MYRLVCVHCGAEYPPKCGHLLAVKYDLDEITVSHEELQKRPISVWRYKEFLPVRIEPVTLQEGGTPLYHLKRLGEELGLPNLYAKHEGMNPSGSFKDRGMTLGVSMAKQLGKHTVACASTGNTSASMAVYAAKAGLRLHGSLRCKGRNAGSRPASGRSRCARQSCPGTDAWGKGHLHSRKL